MVPTVQPWTRLLQETVLDEIEGLVDDGVLSGNWAEDVAGTVQALQDEGVAIGDHGNPNRDQPLLQHSPGPLPRSKPLLARTSKKAKPTSRSTSASLCLLDSTVWKASSPLVEAS